MTKTKEKNRPVSEKVSRQLIIFKRSVNWQNM